SESDSVAGVDLPARHCGDGVLDSGVEGEGAELSFGPLPNDVLPLAVDCRRRGRRAGVPVSNPCTLKSSSTSGQRIPIPSAIISYRARCSGVASVKRHDQSSGTLIVRPSTRWAVITRSVTSTAFTRGPAPPLLLRRAAAHT